MKKQRRFSRSLATFPYPLTKESNLSNSSLRLTRKGKQVRAVILACAFLGIYTGYVQDAKASQEVKKVNTVSQISAYTEMGVKNKLNSLDVDPLDISKKEPTRTKTKSVLPDETLIAVLREAGFEGRSLEMAWAIVMRESTGNPYALNDNPKTGDLSYGLFQINMIGKMGQQRLEAYGLSSYSDLYNPATNARIAFQMSKGGTNWGPWNIGPDAYDRGGQSSDRSSVRKWLSQFPG